VSTCRVTTHRYRARKDEVVATPLITSASAIAVSIVARTIPSSGAFVARRSFPKMARACM
jgi:hypothetical protein